MFNKQQKKQRDFTRLATFVVFTGVFFDFIELDEVVNAKNRDSGFGGEFKTLDLAYEGFENACFFVVNYFSIDQIQSSTEKEA